MAGFETVEVGNWKVMKVSDFLVIFRNMETNEAGEIHVVDGSIEYWEGCCEEDLPREVYIGLDKLGIDYNNFQG